jgi:hypothetical protein
VNLGLDIQISDIIAAHLSMVSSLPVSTDGIMCRTKA